MDSRWRIELLGGLCARQPGRSITRFRTHKTGLLLAYLACHRDRTHSREQVIELLWPDVTPQAGRNQLSMALSFLRHPLEPPGFPAGAVILADRSSVRLNPEAITTDVADFETALRKATTRSGDGERVAVLRAAAELYRGELLPGYYEDWVLGERGRLHEAYGQALQQLTHLYERIGDLARAVATAAQATRHDPLGEEAFSDLLRLYQATGQSALARRVWRDFERRLLDELGETPSLALRTLASSLQIKAEESAAEATSATPHRGVEIAGAGTGRATRKPTPGTKPPTAERTAHVPTRSEPSLHSGTVALLLTDIEGSTAQWQQSGPAYTSALALHHLLLRQQFARHGGHEIKEMGDGFLVAFARPSEALACAIAAQHALAEQPRPNETGAVLVRMALHVGEVEVEEDSDTRGLALHHASRLLSAAQGGQILCSEPAAVLLRGDLVAEVWLEDVGLYRLRDIPSPQRLFQVSYSGMARRDFGSARADRAHSATLPLQLTRFIGREAEIAQLCRLLLPDVKPAISRSSESPRLVTVTGPGGVGKTRLALEVAGQLIEPLSGAVFFAGLAEVREASRLADTLMDALKLARSPQRKPLDQVMECLGRQACVLVLDNFEQLLDEEGRARESVSVVSTLLEGVPSLRVLVTSRQRLGLSGEREFRVAPLQVPSTGEEAGGLTADRLARVESVALFVDRAQMARADFQLTSRNAEAVGELCSGLEGIPLAIELAAARSQVLTPSQMLRQLQGRFKFLVGRGRGVAERHRTLEAAIDWSYRLLPSEMQGFFDALSVFRGGWTLEGAEAVCAGSIGDVLDALEYLHRSSLIAAEENEQGAMRFRMLETLREYASEKLEGSGASDAVRTRHLDCFLALAEEAAPKLSGADQGEWLERLESEHDNLRASLDWSLKGEDGYTSRQDEQNAIPGPSAVAGLRFCSALQLFWWTRGHLSEGREWCVRVLGTSRGQERTQERAKALNGAGVLAYLQGDYASSRAYHEESLTLYREVGDRIGIAGSLSNLGMVAHNQGDYASARANFEQGLTIRREIGDRSSTAASLNNLGNVAGSQGDYISARSYIEESLILYREAGDRRGIAFSLNSLANLVDKQGDHVSAHAYFDESLSLRREIGDRGGIAVTLNNIGNVASGEGDYASARNYYEESLAMQRELGSQRGVAGSLGCLGNVARSLGDPVSARAYFEESVTIFREIGDRSSIAYFLIGLGNVASDQGDYALARTHYAESLAIRRDFGERGNIADTLAVFAGLAARIGKSEQAAVLWAAAEALREELGSSLSPKERDAYDHHVADVRQALGDRAFSTAQANGRAMTLEQAIAYAL